MVKSLLECITFFINNKYAIFKKLNFYVKTKKYYINKSFTFKYLQLNRLTKLNEIYKLV